MTDIIRMDKREQLIRQYFQAWLDQDPASLGEIFAENVIYSECYGPEYRGLSQIKRWFADWNQKGRVLEWRIKGFLHQGNQTAVEWYFRCDYGGKASFDGVSLVTFDKDDKIVSLKEFQSKAEHEFPYGEE